MHIFLIDTCTSFVGLLDIDFMGHVLHDVLHFIGLQLIIQLILGIGL
jgi:hypothetical protein